MSDQIRVHWTVTVWGPRAADNQEHILGGSGKTPEAAIASALSNVDEKIQLARQMERVLTDLEGGDPIGPIGHETC